MEEGTVISGCSSCCLAGCAAPVITLLLVVMLIIQLGCCGKSHEQEPNQNQQEQIDGN